MFIWFDWFLCDDDCLSLETSKRAKHFLCVLTIISNVSFKDKGSILKLYLFPLVAWAAVHFKAMILFFGCFV